MAAMAAHRCPSWANCACNPSSDSIGTNDAVPTGICHEIDDEMDDAHTSGASRAIETLQTLNAALLNTMSEREER